ncbi:MAG: flagellar hook-length control protein FliK [Burkholderiaceae bacterium]
MQTPTVQNQTNVTSSPPQGAKSQSTPDVPFNQMLSQQISDRSNANDASKAPETNQANDTSKVNDTNKASDTTQAGSGNSDSVSKQSGSADATDTKISDKDKTKDTDDASKTDANLAVPVSAELMALVTNHLNQANAKPVDTSVTTTDAKAVAVATDDLSLKADVRTSLTQSRTTAHAKDILSKATDTDTKTVTDKTQITESAGKEAPSKAAANFAATMSAIEQTAESKQVATAKLQDALPAIPTGATSQLQQTALNLTQAASGQPTDKLTPQVGSPAWDQALGQKVVWMVAGSQQSAALTLNPPDLGPMHVVLHVSNGQADATFTASQPEVRQALEAALPKLREMMSDAGIQLGQATISTGMPNQQNKSGDQSGQNARGFGQANDSVDATTRITGTTKITGGQGLVDTFA